MFRKSLLVLGLSLLASSSSFAYEETYCGTLGTHSDLANARMKDGGERPEEVFVPLYRIDVLFGDEEFGAFLARSFVALRYDDFTASQREILQSIPRGEDNESGDQICIRGNWSADLNTSHSILDITATVDSIQEVYLDQPSEQHRFLDRLYGEN